MTDKNLPYDFRNVYAGTPYRIGEYRWSSGVSAIGSSLIQGDKDCRDA